MSQWSERVHQLTSTIDITYDHAKLLSPCNFANRHLDVQIQTNSIKYSSNCPDGKVFSAQLPTIEDKQKEGGVAFALIDPDHWPRFDKWFINLSWYRSDTWRYYLRLGVDYSSGRARIIEKIRLSARGSDFQPIECKNIELPQEHSLMRTKISGQDIFVAPTLPLTENGLISLQLYIAYRDRVQDDEDLDCKCTLSEQ